MSTNTNNQAAGREAQESSGQSSEMKVQIPPEIVAENHRRAYAMAFIAGYNGRKLKFVAPIVRNSIVRGYLTGERERALASAAR